jgi:hypothetical protein
MAKRGRKSSRKRLKRVTGRRAARKTAPRRAAKRQISRPKGAARTAPARGRDARAGSKAPRGPARLDRKRRTLDESVPTPPSSLDMERRGSAARTGRSELREQLDQHGSEISPAITGGDVDADWEEAYFTGDEAPGGDNPTPDQDIVDDIGRALGVEYQDAEELKASDKLIERDKHRWELDPASSEDYKDRR